MNEDLLGGGVYALLLDGEVVYVGQSACLISRIAQHRDEAVKEFDDFQFEYVPEDYRDAAEKELIAMHMPRYNKNLIYANRTNRSDYVIKKCAGIGLDEWVAHEIMRVSHEYAYAN